MEPHGKAAERVVFERLRAALPSPEYRLYRNAEWLGPMREGGPARDGEADLVKDQDLSLGPTTMS
jgi:hypothetical protein